MLQKNIEVKSQQVQSYDEKPIQSLQHSKNKKKIADGLREEIEQLFHKQEKASFFTCSYFQKYKKANVSQQENYADFAYKSYITWFDEEKRLGKEIQVKLKAVQKYESPNQKKKPKIIDKKKQQLKYGPSDEEK